MVFLLVACSGNGDGSEADGHAHSHQQTPIPTLSPVPLHTAVPIQGASGGRRTGITVIDDVIVATENKDASTLFEMVQPYKCPANLPIPCPPGVVDVLGSAECQAGFEPYQSSAVRARFNRWIETVDSRVYAVLQQGVSGLPSVGGKYLVLFKSGHGLVLNEAGVTYLYFPCGNVDAVVDPAASFILAPMP